MSTFGTRAATRQIGAFTIALTHYAAESALPWHEHSDAYLTFVVGGEYRESLRDSARDCDARSIVYHPAGERHADRFGPRLSSCLDIRFDGGWLSSLAARGCAIARPAMLDARGLGSRVLAEFLQPDALSPMIVEGLLLELFAEKERASEARKTPAWLRSVRDMLESRTLSIALTRLASIAGVHPTHLARAFRAHYGCTVGEFVRAQRIEDAKQHLRTSRPLSEIALDLGFSDQSHFTRTFRRITGMTPAAYRRQSR
jgi:AraC family transcriptional regulator